MINKLKTLIKTILNKNSSHFELLNSTKELSKFFANYCDICTEDNHTFSKYSTHTNLSSGVAISPLDAAICTNEYLRTTKYIRGVYEAIKDLKNRFKEEKVHLLYAGTGPYATLVLPLLSFFDTKELEVTFLDINKDSLNSVKSILKALSLEHFAKEFECCDASTYKIKSKTHLIVTETMRAVFEGEPQVNITLNLLPQLCKEGLFIPESVTIYLEQALKKIVPQNNHIKNIKKAHFIGDIIKLDTKKECNKKSLVSTPSLKIEQELKEGFELYLCTQIKVYTDNILNKNECSLNLPMKLNLNTKVQKDDILEFYYEFENRPELIYKLIKNDKNNLPNEFKNLYPINVSFKYKNSMVLCKELLTNRFLKPFFDNELKKAHKKYLSWKEFEQIANKTNSLEPKGFIFHTSRCGSTLLCNALSSLEKNIVIKESAFIYDILSLNYKEQTSKIQIKQRLKDAMKVLAKKRFDFEENFFIKFNSWEIEHIKLIKELYPNTPIIILYRNPLEILNSHKKLSGMQMVPTLLNGKIFDSIEKETLFNEYPMRVLENIFEEITLQKNEKNTMIINYEDIKKIFFSKIALFFNLALNKQEKEAIQYSFNLYSKNPSQNFDINNEIIDKTITISSKLQKSFKLLETIKES